ncbi:anoctamin-5-like isoform X1 [Tachypleus tridentatus]|uniref:anoctamin-5-like isoform X1 n=1 Tax=Tachypleus tridentatus TaxID=6853 RepID=UPI003FD5B1D5
MKMPMKEVPEFQYSRGDEKKLKRGISGVCHSISNLFASKTSKRQQFTTEYRRAREYLFDVPEKKEEFFNSAQRSQIVEFILKRKRFSNNEESYAFGITKLINDNVYEAAFPLHEGIFWSENRPLLCLAGILYLHADPSFSSRSAVFPLWVLHLNG